jgi:hypothetical protein
MAFRAPTRHWQSNGTEPLPSPTEALEQPMRAFPSWFLRVECDRCGKAVMRNESRLPGHQRGMVLRVLLHRMRHESCGGQAARAELLTDVDGAFREVRRIVLMG